MAYYFGFVDCYTTSGVFLGHLFIWFSGSCCFFLGFRHSFGFCLPGSCSHFFFFSCGFFLSGFVFSFNCQMVPSWEPGWASTTTARMLITTYYGCWLEGWVGFDRGDDAWRLRASMRGDICI